MKQRVKVMAKCDRCGKILEKHDKEHYRILKVNAETTTDSPYSRSCAQEKYWSAIKDKMELCPSCIDSFKSNYMNWVLAPQRGIKRRCTRAGGLINSHDQCRYYGWDQLCCYQFDENDKWMDNKCICPLEYKCRQNKEEDRGMDED